MRAAIWPHHRLTHPVVTLICKLDKPSENQWNKWNQHLIYLDPIVNRVKTLTARCKVAFFLNSSSPGVLDWAWMFKSSFLHFQPTCILCYVSFCKGLFSHTDTPNTSAGTCVRRYVHVFQIACVQHSWRKHQCCAMLISPAGLSTSVHWLTSLERVQPAPLIPPTLANWHKGQGREREARAWPAFPPACFTVHVPQGAATELPLQCF